MKALHTIKQIAELLGRHKFTISRELRRNAGFSGYRPKQACELVLKHSESRSNASTIAPSVKEQSMRCYNCNGVLSRWRASCGKSCAARNRRKRYASGQDRRGQIPNRRPLSERPVHIKGRKQVGHWECDAAIGAKYKQVIMTVVKRKSGFVVVAKASNKTAYLVGAAIISMLKPFEVRVKALTYDNGKEFCGHAKIDNALNSAAYFARLLIASEICAQEALDGNHYRRGN